MPAACDSKGDVPVIRAVVFDLDGTLIDTEQLSTEAIQAVVGQWGKTFTWETKKKILGMRGEEWGKIVIHDVGLDGQLDPAELVTQWEQHMFRMSPQVKALPGADDTIAYFRSLGIPQAIATSSSAELVAHKRMNHGAMFDAMATVVTGDDPEVKSGKPSPDIYLAAARRLGVDPRHCVAFEDALNGVRSARAAGMHVVAIPDPRLDRAPFHAEAHQVLSSLAEFMPCRWGLPPRGVNSDRLTPPPSSSSSPLTEEKPSHTT